MYATLSAGPSRFGSKLTRVTQVLSEVYRPKRYFAKSTIAGEGLAAVLFLLVNISYVRKPTAITESS